MDVRLLFPTEYLGAADLKGKDVDLTIASLAVEDLRTDGGTEKKPCIYFEEVNRSCERNGTKPKKLVLNKTNMKAIAALHGYEADEWTGKRITLFPTTCPSFGEIVDCIRVKPTVPKPKPEPAVKP